MDRSLSTLIYGASKSGKSSLSVTCPAPRLYMDVEAASRFLPIRKVIWDPQKEAPPELDGTWNTAVVPTRDWSTVERAYQWLASGQHPFKSLIVDSVSELQQRYIEAQSGRQQPTMQNWGATFRVVSGLVRDLRDLTIHPTKPLEAVVLTAMARQIDGMWRPWLQGQIQTVLPYLVDATLYLWVEQEADELTGETSEKRKALTRRTSQFEAGERVGGRLPVVLDIQSLAPGEEGNDIERWLDVIFGAPVSAITPTAPSED